MCKFVSSFIPQQGLTGTLEPSGSDPRISPVTLNRLFNYLLDEPLIVQRVVVRMKQDIACRVPGIQLMFCLCIFNFLLSKTTLVISTY